MKFKIIYTSFFLGLLALLFLGNSNGRATQANWGNTGAPGDETFANGNSRTCQSCHNGSTAFQVSLDIDLLDGDGNSILDEGYVPGETYTARVTIDPVMGTPNGYGFQMVALDCIDCDENSEDVDTWSDPAANVKIATANNTNRTYIEHNGVGNNGIFEAMWTAPDTEGVTFYACGNGVNQDGSSGTGDNSDIMQVTVPKAVASSQLELAAVEQFEVFPNPTKGDINLTIELASAGTYSLNLYDLTGRNILSQELDLGTGTTFLPVSTADLESGIYMLQLVGQNGQLTKRVLKQ